MNMRNKVIKNIRPPLDLLLIFFLGLVPFLWFKGGYIIARGDYFPFWMVPEKTLGGDQYLWSSHNLGIARTWPTSLIYGYIWLLLLTIGLEVGIAQILLQTFFLLGSGVSMYFLVGLIYPKLRFAPLGSSVFYMFNFFVVQSRLNIGMEWTYAFLPVLMIFLIRTFEASLKEDIAAVNKNACYFALASTLILSFASANPTNVVLALIVLGVLSTYYFLGRQKVASLFKASIKLAISFGLANLWWIIPTLNCYVLSSSSFNPDINVLSWSWTHSRASFLNMFLLNGFWGWRPEYFPHYDAYSNPILIILLTIPFLLAAATFLFKTEKSLFNSYIVLFSLIFIFLAKGLHEPLSQVNLLLYSLIPSMAMFREPTTKFTMASIPFLSLLIGYAVHHIAGIKVSKHQSGNLTKTAVFIFFLATFIISAFPLITNPIETRTSQIPFSSYVRIPDYWQQATQWLDHQSGDYKILVTPADDHYQMPYTWGYFGTDEFLERLIQKPIVSNHYAYYYKTTPDVTLTIEQLYRAIKYNRTDEFKILLDLLNIKYILQRNDVQFNFADRNIIAPDEMQIFLTSQPYIHLAQRFTELYIYEYEEWKPNLYILDPKEFKKTAIRIEKTDTQHSWDFNSLADVQEWDNATDPNQWQTTLVITPDNDALKAQLWNSTWGWKSINSPLFPGSYGKTYEIQIEVKARDAAEIHVKIAEYDQKEEIITATYATYINDGTFDWTHTQFDYEPTNKTTKYLQIQIWNGHETDKLIPNTLWVDNVKIYDYRAILNSTGFDSIFQDPNQPASIINYSIISPTKSTLEINASMSFILAMSEALDESWTAYVNEMQYKPIPLYLGLKGFNITQTGLLEITIEYEPQKWFLYGSIISLSTAIVCIAYLAHGFIKSAWRRTRIFLKIREREMSTKQDPAKTTI
jgi:hypothetical protein